MYSKYGWWKGWQEGSSDVEFIADAFDGSDAIDAQFLADLADMHIDGTVSNDHIRTPDVVQYLVAEEDSAWFGGQQVEQFKFFFARLMGCPL